MSHRITSAITSMPNGSMCSGFIIFAWSLREV
jgi:hypothetical protein